MEAIVAVLGVNGTVTLASAIAGPVAHNLIPQQYQFWAKDDNNLGRVLGKCLKKIARDIAADGELDGDKK